MADTINTNLGTGESKSFAQEIEVCRQQGNCHFRSSASLTIPEDVSA